MPLADKLVSWSSPDFKSENEIITVFLNNLREKFLAQNKDLSAEIVFLLDTGFYRSILIKYLLKLGISFIINAVGDRNIILTNKKIGERIETKLENLETGYYQQVYIKHRAVF